MQTTDLSWHLLMKDEEEAITPLCRRIAAAVGEIVIVDTGSTDRSIEIAQGFTPKVFSFEWDWDFSAARNFGLEQATRPWILQIDADEWPNAELLSWIHLWEPPVQCDGVWIRRHNLVGGQPIGPENTFEWHPRLFRRECRYEGRIHERPIITPHSMTVAPGGCLILHHKSLERQERQNAFYQHWEEQRAHNSHP